jgi:hypothetical protein
MFCYILESDYVAYLASQEDLLLQVMGTLEKAGAVVALPTQTTLVTQDSWFDPKRGKEVIEKINTPEAPETQTPR